MWCKGSRVRVSSFAQGIDAGPNARRTTHAEIGDENQCTQKGSRGKKEETGAIQSARVDEGEMENDRGVEKVHPEKERV